MGKLARNYILLVGVVLLASSCSRIQFREVNLDQNQKVSETLPEITHVFEKNIQLRSTRERFVQETALDNQIEFVFSAQDSEGFNFSQIKKEDLAIAENNKVVSEFNFDFDQQNIGKKVDLVIVLDVSNSMEETILLVKEKVKGFVKTLEQKRWNSTLCLVTFRDHTVSTCTRLVEDDPKTAKNENLEYFLAELAKAKTKPSGDWDENQLRGLIDAAEKTPWRNNAQRVAVLMTNSTFNYAPNSKGDAGSDAPTYEETLSVLKKKQLQVFTVAPKAAGYDKAFSSDLSPLHRSRGGAYFNFSQMLNGRVPLDQIFQAIIDRLSTEYRVIYSCDGNALDPGLTLNSRQIRLALKSDPTIQFHLLRSNADWPQGRPELKKKWRLKSQALRSGIKTVKVNGKAISSSTYSVENSELHFAKAPSTQSSIEVEYDSSDLQQLLGKPTVVKSNVNLKLARFAINGYEVPVEKLNLEHDSKNLWFVDLSGLTESDLFELKVYPDRQLNLKIESASTIEEVQL